MKRAFLTMAAVAGMLTANAQGKFETIDLQQFKLHVYYTGDAMGDAAYIVEGPTKLYTLEEPLMTANFAEFVAYMQKLNKPVEKNIVDYHLGGTTFDKYVTPQGMRDYFQGPQYSGMMNGFKGGFGDQMLAIPDVSKAEEVPFGVPQTWDGISFLFTKGPATGFPAADILIGGKVLLTHWGPAKAHMSGMQVGSMEAVAAELADAEAALKSGATYFVGGHGGAVAGRDVVEFKVAYLKKIQELRAANNTADAFADALKKAFPGLEGENNVEAIAGALYR